MTTAERIQTTANVSIICVALITVPLLIWNLVTPTRLASPSHTPPIGKVIKLSDTNWAMTSKTVILALNTDCHFCRESAPFYKKLTTLALDKQIPVVAIFPQPTGEGREYLTTLGVAVTDIKQAQLKDIFVTGTPTVMIIDRKGIVRSGWVGKLSEDGERNVIAAL